MFFRTDRSKRPVDGVTLSRKHALACVPLKNPEVVAKENDNGELLLSYQVRIQPWFLNIVRRITGRSETLIERKLQLDGLGSTVWIMIDGRRRAEEIIEDFRRQHQLNRREAEISVTAFLKELGKRGLIVMRGGGN